MSNSKINIYQKQNLIITIFNMYEKNQLTFSLNEEYKYNIIYYI